MSRLLALCLTFCLAGCGWQLRGQGPGDLDLDNLSGAFIQAAGNNSVADALHQQLRLMEVPVLNELADGSIGIRLAMPVVERRIQTVSGDLRARQIRLQMNLDFSLLDDQGEVLTSDSLMAVRTYDQNPVQPTTAGLQQEQLEREMAEELAGVLIRLLPQHVFSASENPG